MLTTLLRLITQKTSLLWKSLFVSFFIAPGLIYAQNQAPEISNLSAQENEEQGTVTVSYDLSDNEGDAADITFRISTENSMNYLSGIGSLSGDIGDQINPGSGKEITWDFPDSMASNITDYEVNLVADDRQAVDVQSIVDRVDSQRLKNLLETIAGLRHPDSGLAHLNAVKDTIENRFSSNGLTTDRQGFTHNGYNAHNIIGDHSGIAEGDTAYIIDAHFDAVQGSPGADDNGSAVAGMLEAARILSDHHFDHSIKFIGFDLEEAGLLGSQKYVESGIEANVQLEGVFNFEMIGYSSTEKNTQNLPFGFDQLYPDVYSEIEADSFRGDFITNVANGDSEGLMATYDSAASWYVPGLDVINVGSNQTGSMPQDLRRSDHANFWDNGYKALMLTNTADFRNPNYHTPEDTVGYFDYTFMTNVVKATIGAICEEAGIKNSTASSAGIEEDPSTSVLQHENGENGFKIYPNPVISQDQIQIVAKGDKETLQVQVFNSQGKLVLSREKALTNNGRLSLNIGQLKPGVYHVGIEDRNDVRKKVIIQ